MRVLLIEDNAGDAELVRSMLDSVHLEWVPSLDEGVARLNQGGFDAVLLDLSLPDSQGIESVETAHLFDAETPIIVLTGLDDEESAMAALAAGAHDYLVKDKTDEASLRKAIQFAKQRMEVQRSLGGTDVEAHVAAITCPVAPAFFDALAASAQAFMSPGPLLYVATDKSASVLQGRMMERGVPAKDIHFIDASGSAPSEEETIHVVDDPLDLPELTLEVERACAALGPKTHVLLDSINAVFLRHGLDDTSMFFHTLTNRLRLLGISAHFVGHDNQEWPFLRDRLSFLDSVKKFQAPEESAA